MELSDSSPAKVNPGIASPSIHIEEGSLLAELAIFEYFLHQSIILRLDNLSPLDRPQPPAERLSQLRRAHYYSQLIQKMLESLRVIFAEESLPFDESLARRLEVAKLIGLTFFYNSNSTPPLRVGVDDDGYWQGWRMTREDREASIMSIFKLTTDILVGNVPMAIELATQACLLSGGRLPTAPAWTGKEYEQEITERMATLDEMINSLGGEEETAAIAETRWPWTPVAASLLTALRTFYKQMEPPIISKFCEDAFANVPGEGGQSKAVPGPNIDEISRRALRLTSSVTTAVTDNLIPIQESTLVSNQTQTQAQSQVMMPSLEADSQFNFMTQPPNILMATESEDAGETRGEQGEVTAADREQTIPIASVSAPDQTAESIPSRRSIGPHPPFASSDEEENIAPLTQNIPKDLNMGARKGRSKDDRPKGRKRNDSIVSAKTVSTVTRSKRDLPPSSPRPDRLGEDGHLSANNQGTHRPPPSSGSSLSGRLLELVESMPVIPPEAFRGLICRNNDDEIASIMERRHPLVRKFISTRDAATGARKKRRTKEAIKSPKRSISKSRASSHQPSSKRPLLDRHDSAERIAWSPSAHGSPSPLKDDPMRPPLRNPTPPDRPVIAVDKIRVAPRSPSFTTVTGAGAAVTSSFSPLPGGEPRRRRKWSEDETAALICGYNRYGPDWRHILQTYGHHFDRRSNVDLKDRARILKRQGLIK